MVEKKSAKVRREEIIIASLSLVKQYGLDNLNIADIAREVGVVPSAIYRHFEGKEAIIESLIEFANAILQGNISKTLIAESNAVSRLECLFNLHVKLIKEHGAIPRILFSLLSSDKNVNLKQKMLLLVNTYVANIKKIIVEGQLKGEILPEVNVEAAGISFLGMLQPMALLSQFNADLINLYPKPLWEIYRRGITR